MRPQPPLHPSLFAPRSGLSLVEVMVALAVFAAGVVPILYGVAAGLRLAARGHARGDLAAALLSRMAELRRVARATDPACAALGGGSAAGRVTENWTVDLSNPGLAEVVLQVSIPVPGGILADTLTLRLPCG